METLVLGKSPIYTPLDLDTSKPADAVITSIGSMLSAGNLHEEA